MSNNTRRGFLKSTTGAGLLICSSRTAFGFKANEKLNIAGIGVGGQGVCNIRSVAGENIVALCEVDTRRGQPTLKNFPKVKLYQDYRKMLSEMDKQIDAKADKFRGAAEAKDTKRYWKLISAAAEKAFVHTLGLEGKSAE